MEASYIIKENWLTRKPSPTAFNATIFITFILFLASQLFFADLYNTDQWMPASGFAVFNQSEYWRLWTALFAHADLGHLMSNSIMFIPLTYLLTSYFGFVLFPVVGILSGGIINILVLKSLPLESSLIGISGVVYWMAAVWLTLFFLIDTRKSLRRRFATALFIMVMLFIPQSYEPQISYLSHFLGGVFGVLTAIIYYFINQKIFLAAEVKELIVEDDFIISKQGDVPLQGPEISEAQ